MREIIDQADASQRRAFLAADRIGGVETDVGRILHHVIRYAMHITGSCGYWFLRVYEFSFFLHCAVRHKFHNGYFNYFINC